MTEAEPEPEAETQEGHLVPWGWYQDPTDSSKERYWDGKWSKQSRKLGGPTAPPLPPRAGSRDTDANAATSARRAPSRRVLIIATVAGLVVVVIVAVLAWALLRRDERPPRGNHDTLDNLVYTFVSPKVPCCSEFRNEGTANFTVDGNWRVDWQLSGQGEPCQVVGRVVDAKAHRFAKLPTFGPKPSGSKVYRRPGTYSIALEYRCQSDSVATAEIRVFSSST